MHFPHLLSNWGRIQLKSLETKATEHLYCDTWNRTICTCLMGEHTFLIHTYCKKYDILKCPGTVRVPHRGLNCLQPCQKF